MKSKKRGRTDNLIKRLIADRVLHGKARRGEVQYLHNEVKRISALQDDLPEPPKDDEFN